MKLTHIYGHGRGKIDFSLILQFYFSGFNVIYHVVPI